MFPPGRVKIAKVPGFKDANEALVARQGSKILDAIYGAKSFRPDGIVEGKDLWEDLTDDSEETESIPYPMEQLNEITLGMRRGELIVWCSGTGMGKSAIMRELEFHLIRKGEKVGIDPPGGRQEADGQGPHGPRHQSADPPGPPRLQPAVGRREGRAQARLRPHPRDRQGVPLRPLRQHRHRQPAQPGALPRQRLRGRLGHPRPHLHRGLWPGELGRAQAARPR